MRADHIGVHRLHRVELAGRHLLQRGGVIDEIDPAGDAFHGAEVAHVRHVVLDPAVAEALALVFLLLLVPADDPHLRHRQRQEVLQDRGAERARAAGDQDGRARELAGLQPFGRRLISDHLVLECGAGLSRRDRRLRPVHPA